MALIHLQKLYRNNKVETGGVVLNTKFIGELRADTYVTQSASNSWFKYFNLPEDRRGGYDQYVVSRTRASIKTHADLANYLPTISLATYIDQNPLNDTENIMYHIDEIVKAYPYHADPTLTWLHVNEKGFKVRKYLVDIYYVDLVGVSLTGTSSTTTSTSSTSSTSTTSTTSRPPQ